MNIIIETDRLILREFSESDTLNINKICTEESVIRWMPDWNVTPESMMKWVEWVQFSYKNSDQSNVRIMLAITLKESGELIGMVGVGNKEEVDDEVEVAYFITEKMSGMGYVSEAVSAMSDWALKRFDLEYLIGIVDPLNYPSQKVLERSGFSQIGVKMLINAGEKEKKPYYYYRLIEKE